MEVLQNAKLQPAIMKPVLYILHSMKHSWTHQCIFWMTKCMSCNVIAGYGGSARRVGRSHGSASSGFGGWKGNMRACCSSPPLSHQHSVDGRSGLAAVFVTAALNITAASIHKSCFMLPGSGPQRDESFTSLASVVHQCIFEVLQRCCGKVNFVCSPQDVVYFHFSFWCDMWCTRA